VAPPPAAIAREGRIEESGWRPLGGLSWLSGRCKDSARVVSRRRAAGVGDVARHSHEPVRSV